MLDPMRERRLKMKEEPIGDFVREGTLRASEIAEEVLGRAEEVMFIGFPS